MFAKKNKRCLFILNFQRVYDFKKNQTINRYPYNGLHFVTASTQMVLIAEMLMDFYCIKDARITNTPSFCSKYLVLIVEHFSALGLGLCLRFKINFLSRQ